MIPAVSEGDNLFSLFRTRVLIYQYIIPTLTKFVKIIPQQNKKVNHLYVITNLTKDNKDML